MLVAVHHKIARGKEHEFWDTTFTVTLSLPPGLKILQVAVSSNGMSQAVCLWEATSVEALKNFIGLYVGHISENEFFEVDNEQSLGLPCDGTG